MAIWTFLSECRNNKNDSSKDKAHVELQSEANPHYRNGDNNEIHSSGRFLFLFFCWKRSSYWKHGKLICEFSLPGLE